MTDLYLHQIKTIELESNVYLEPSQSWTENLDGFWSTTLTTVDAKGHEFGITLFHDAPITINQKGPSK